MAQDSGEIRIFLEILKLEDRKIENLSIREVIRAYRSLARSVHPDTSGYDSKEDFQKLGNAYESVLRIVVAREKSNDGRRDENMEEMFRDFYI